jgi:integrase
MFNTGARVQEIVSLRVGDVRFDKPLQVRLFGTGRKERICPLWPQTAEILREFLAERAGEPLVSDPLFPNRDGATLSVRGSLYPDETLRASSSCETHTRRQAPAPAQHVPLSTLPDYVLSRCPRILGRARDAAAT